MENVSMIPTETLGFNTVSVVSGVSRSQPTIKDFPKNFFSDCIATDLCTPQKPFSQNYYEGTCIPNKANVLACAQDLSKCVCSTVPRPCEKINPECAWQIQIMDIYIVNNTDQQLHLKDSNIGLEVTEEPGPEEDAELGVRNPVGDFLVGWIDSTFQPPKVIDIGDTVLIRGATQCTDKCCRSNVVFKIDVLYSIGEESKGLGSLSASLCRTKPKETKRSVDDCKVLLSCGLGFGCKVPFGVIRSCPGTSIEVTPVTSIYSANPRITESQVVIEVDGGTTGGCSSRKDCPDGQRCVSGRCISSTGATGCSNNTDCKEGLVCKDGFCERENNNGFSRQTAIIVAVSVTVVIIVYAFLFFLADLSKKK